MLAIPESNHNYDNIIMLNIKKSKVEHIQHVIKSAKATCQDLLTEVIPANIELTTQTKRILCKFESLK